MTRFVLGIVIMIGSLVFLGCPLRMVLRMSAGDLNAYVALIGFILGIATGIVALKKGFSLGRAHETNKMSGAVLPVLMVGILILAVGTTLLASSTEGPGSKHAPIAIALIGGLLFGAFAQKSRMCFAGSIRDVILMKNFDLLSVIGGLFVVMLIYNIATGNFILGFDTPGIIAHSEHLWNILGMYTVGFAATLAGGCPLRQLVLAGQGSSDAGMTVIGMFVGQLFATIWDLLQAEQQQTQKVLLQLEQQHLQEKWHVSFVSSYYLSLHLWAIKEKQRRYLGKEKEGNEICMK